MEAADGLYEWLRKKVDGFIDINNGKTVYQIKPFVLGEITEANIGEKLFQGTGMAAGPVSSQLYGSMVSQIQRAALWCEPGLQGQYDVR